MRKYLKRLDIYLASGSEKDNKGCLLALVTLPAAAIIALFVVPLILNFVFGEQNYCRKHPQTCYCDSLAQESRPAEREKLLKEIKERGYSCVGIYYQE